MGRTTKLMDGVTKVMSDVTKPGGGQLPTTTCCRDGIARRRVLQGAIGVAGALAAGPAFAEKPEDTPAQIGDLLVTPLGKNPLGPDNVRLNAGPFEVWPMSPDGIPRRGTLENQLHLFRFNPADIAADIRDKCPEGVVALTAICTHSGCPVTDYVQATGVLTCPCHGSQFMPKQGGALVHGPAVRKLPMLAIALKDGKFVVSGPFDGRVGGDFPVTDDH